MTTLYRGLRQEPVILTPEVSVGKSKSYLDFFGGPQDFCDEEKTAQEYAGKNGFYIKVDLPNDLAKKYQRGPILIELSEDNSIIVRQVNRYEITGLELAEHMMDWNYRSISMQEGYSFKEKR